MTAKGRYSADELEVLVEEYAELRYSSRAFVRVRLMDLERAMRHTHTKMREALLLHGMLGLPTRRIGELLGCDPSTVRRRYTRGLEQLMAYLNGGHHRKTKGSIQRDRNLGEGEPGKDAESTRERAGGF